MNKRHLALAVFCIGVVAAQFAWAGTEGEFSELLAIYRDHRTIYDGCYQLAMEKVLTGKMREELVNGAADRNKGLACALGITSSEAGIRVTDSVSLRKLQGYFTNQKRCAEALVDLKNARTAIEMYYLDNAKYPATLEEAATSHAVSFRSPPAYRPDRGTFGYFLSTTNDGCDRTFFFSTEAPEIRSTEKKGSPDRN
ncbi:MAG TPA: hypothetical protein VI298_15290 [Geobacteraceae bacterium]